jgi:hypothetical protein
VSAAEARAAKTDAGTDGAPDVVAPEPPAEPEAAADTEGATDDEAAADATPEPVAAAAAKPRARRGASKESSS